MKPFPGVRTKAMKHYVGPDLVILHTAIKDLKSISSPEEITNEIISVALSVKGNGQQIAVPGIIPQGDRFPPKN